MSSLCMDVSGSSWPNNCKNYSEPHTLDPGCCHTNNNDVRTHVGSTKARAVEKTWWYHWFIYLVISTYLVHMATFLPHLNLGWTLSALAVPLVSWPSLTFWCVLVMNNVLICCDHKSCVNRSWSLIIYWSVLIISNVLTHRCHHYELNSCVHLLGQEILKWSIFFRVEIIKHCLAK